MAFRILSLLSLKYKAVLGRFLGVACPEQSRREIYVRWKPKCVFLCHVTQQHANTNYVGAHVHFPMYQVSILQ